MKKILLAILFILSLCITAQEKDKYLPKGNEKFKSKDYVNAEAEYRISQSKSPTKATSSYNLGNAIYRQNQTSEAKNAYLKAVENARTRPQKHYAFHNLGNVYMKEKKYTEAVEAYKNALRYNPADEESRYNLALAKEYLKNNPPPKDKKDDKKDDKKENKENKDKKDDNGDKDKKNKDGKPKEEGQPKPKPAGISKQRVENLLEAVNNEEKKVQDKVNDKKPKGRPVKTEKDW